MNLTDEQWAVIEPLIPEKERMPRVGRGRPWRNPREVLDGVRGFCAQMRNGKTCRSGTRHTRRAIEGSNAGCAKA